MLNRKWFLSTVLCGGLALTCGFGGTAMASGVLQPNTGWAVSKLAAAQTGGEPYCALARRFSNNIILTLARNSSDESSVAIDFQKTALNNTQAYQVTLNPGFGQDRAFNIRPVSGKALIVRLGKDYAFHDALGRSGKLGLDISGQEYTFNISDFSEGQQKLGGCLVNLVEPAAGDTADMMTPPPPQASVQSQPIKVSEPVAAPAPAPAPVQAVVSNVSDAELQSLTEENIKLRNALERERRIYEDRLLQEGQGSSVSAELNEKLRLLEIENDGLRKQLAYVPPAPEPKSCPIQDTSELDALRVDMTSLKSENAQLKQNLASASVKAAEQGSAQRELQAMKSENARLQQSLASATTDSTAKAALSAEVETMRAENARLRAELNDATSKIAGQSVMKSELESLRTENTRLQQGLLSATNDVAGQGVMKRELEMLKMENTRLQDSLAAKSADAAGIAGLKREIELLTSENTRLQESLVSASSDAGVSTALQGQIASLQDENMRLKQDIAKQEAENALLERQIAESGTPEDVDSAAVARLRDRISQLEIENKTLRADNTGAADAMNSVSLAQLRSVEEQLRYVQAERDQLLAQIDGKANTKHAELLDISSDNWNLEQATRRFNEAEREIRRLGQQLEDQRTKCAVAKKELEYMLFDPALADQEQISKLIELENKVAELENSGGSERIAALEAENASYQELFAALKDEKTELVGKIARLETALNSIESAGGVDDDVVATLKSENAALKQERERIQIKEQTLQQHVALLEQDLVDLQLKLNAANTGSDFAAIEKLQAENRTLREDLSTMVSQKETLAQRVAYLESALAGIPTGAGSSATVASAPAPVSSEPVNLWDDDQAYDAYIQTADAGTAQQYEQYEMQASGYEPPTSVSAAPVAVTPNAGSIQSLLDQARISLAAPVVAEQGELDTASYSWDTGTLFGSAEQKPLPDAARFEEYVQAYLQKTGSRCTGDFATVPVLSEHSGSMSVSSYEIACIAGDQGAAASIVFYNQGGTFTVIAHEAGLDAMESAMDARDALTNVLLQGQLAYK